MPAEASSGPAAQSAAGTLPSKILVVEDQALIAMLIETVLCECGYEVVLASNGEEALALASSLGELSAVVTDIHLLGRMDGRAVIRGLRRHRPGMPVVVVTGFHPGAPEANLRGLGGPTIRLGKPFAPEELVASLANVLARGDGCAADPSGTARRGRAAQGGGGLAVGGLAPRW